MKKLNYMNNDIPFEVLSRFAAKDLIKLKLVCKEWHSLISDRCFIRFQIKNTEPLSGFFFQEKYQWTDCDIDRMSYISLESAKIHPSIFNFLPDGVVLLSSCNGLVCCRSTLPSPQPALYVCNPLNKDWISLKWNQPSRNTSVALVFDPLRFPIGNASTIFKVVTVSRTATKNGGFEFLFDIYSSETGNWKQSKETCGCQHALFKNKGVFVDGCLYWLTDGNKILMFDPELELSWLITMPLPLSEFDRTPEMCIGESKGKLHYVMLSEQGLQLWVLKDHFASDWDLKFSISLRTMEQENPKLLFRLAKMMTGSHDVDQPWMDLLSFKDDVLFARVSTYVHAYDFGTRKIKRLCNLTELGKNSLFSPVVLPYSMSLAPVAAM